MFVSRFALLSILLAITACGDPLDITMTPSKETPIPQKVLDAATEEERALLLRGAFRRSLASGLSGGDASIGAVNLRDLVDEQREVEAKLKAEADAAKALQAEIAARREADLAAVRGLVTAVLTDITLREANWRVGRHRDILAIEVAVKNTGPKEITGIKGRLVAVDSFATPVANVSIAWEYRIPAGETAIYEGALDYNQFIDNHRALLGFNTTNGTTVFEPERINFADGTHVDVAPSEE